MLFWVISLKTIFVSLPWYPPLLLILYMVLMCIIWILLVNGHVAAAPGPLAHPSHSTRNRNELISYHNRKIMTTNIDIFAEK